MEEQNKAEDMANSISDKLGPKDVKVQSKLTMILVCWFLGGFGVHRYMMGYSNWWMMTITFGGCGIWTIIDLIKIITDKMVMADGTALEK